MADYKKIMTTNLNLDKFQEEFKALGLTNYSGVTVAGFEKPDADGVAVLFTETREVGKRKDANGVVLDMADAGELRFSFDPALTTQEEAALDAAIANHDPLLKTQEQTRRQTDAGVLAQVVINLSRSEWDTSNNAKKQETIRRGLLLLLRGNFYSDVDTDD